MTPILHVIILIPDELLPQKVEKYGLWHQLSKLINAAYHCHNSLAVPFFHCSPNLTETILKNETGEIFRINSTDEICNIYSAQAGKSVVMRWNGRYAN
jgi:hypothetical protein